MLREFSRERYGRMAAMLREQLNDMLSSAHGLGQLLGGDRRGAEHLAVLNHRLLEQLRMTEHMEMLYLLSGEDELRLHPGDVDLVALCRDLMEQVTDLAQLVGVTARFESGQDELVVYADGEKLSRMVLYLISNALSALSGSGTLRLSVKKQKDQAVIILDDNGGGLDAETLAAFFDQGEEEVDVPEQPTLGLGLPLARKIVSLHGGNLLVDNYAGEGLRVYVTVPCGQAQPPTLLHTDILPRQQSGWNRVLVELSPNLPTSFFTHEELMQWN